MVDKSEPLISAVGSVPDQLYLLNDSLADKQLLCIEYVCEFGLGISKEQIKAASAKDERGKLIFDAIYTLLSQKFLNDAPSLLRLILNRLRYSTRDETIKTNILTRLPIMTKPDTEAIYRNYPNFDMWLTLTVAMISMSDSDYKVLRDHLRLKVLTGYSETGIMSPCHLLELMKNKPAPHGFDSNSLNNVLKWFKDCGLKYPKEIIDYQKRHNKQVPTHWEICCKRTCCLSFCLSIVATPIFISMLLLLTLPNYPHVTTNDAYSGNYSVGVGTVVKIGEVYRSNVVKKLQVEALQNINGFYANGTVIHRVQGNEFNVSSKQLEHVNRVFPFTDEYPVFLKYYNVSSPLYNADGPGVVNFSFNLTNNNGSDCAVRLAIFSSHDDYIQYYDADPNKLPRDIPQNAYNFTPCLNESGIYHFSLNMARDAFSFFAISHIMNVNLTVNISGYVSEYSIHDQEISCILSPSCPDIIISDEECSTNDDDDERWYIFGTSSSRFRGEVNLTVYPLCDKDYKNQYLVAGVVPGGALFLLLVVCGLSCLMCSCISVSRNTKKSRLTRKSNIKPSRSSNVLAV